MEPVLPDLRRKRRTPGDERTGAVRRADRGFFVLIPDQRPSERFAPEVPDLARTVARDRSETSAGGEEGVARLDDAELVAFGVGEHDMVVVGRLTDVDVAGAELDQPLDRFLLVVERRGRQIEMDAVLARLLLRDQAGTGSRTWWHPSARDRSRHRSRRRSPSAAPRPRSARGGADRSRRSRERRAERSSGDYRSASVGIASGAAAVGNSSYG